MDYLELRKRLQFCICLLTLIGSCTCPVPPLNMFTPRGDMAESMDASSSDDSSDTIIAPDQKRARRQGWLGRIWTWCVIELNIAYCWKVCDIMAYYDTTWHDTLWHVMTRYDMTHYDTLWHVMTRHATIWNRVTYNQNHSDLHVDFFHPRVIACHSVSMDTWDPIYACHSVSYFERTFWIKFHPSCCPIGDIWSLVSIYSFEVVSHYMFIVAWISIKHIWLRRKAPVTCLSLAFLLASSSTINVYIGACVYVHGSVLCAKECWWSKPKLKARASRRR